MPEAMPAPYDGSQLSPSSLVVAEALVVVPRRSWETTVWPLFESVQRMGSKLCVPVIGLCFATHVDDGEFGQESSKVTRKVVRNDWKSALPLIQFAPIDGSPASVPRPVASCAADGVNTE